MHLATAVVHTAPAMGAGFTEYTAEMQPNGSLGPCALQRFVFVIEGRLEITIGAKKEELSPGGYFYVPPGVEHSTRSLIMSRALVIEKPYEHLEGISVSDSLVGHEFNVASEPLMGDPDLQVRILLPTDFVFDFAVNTMAFQPGASLPMVESHVMEHGLIMLEGGGIYRLNDCWYPVSAGDFIWMAPYCPQWFGALGKTPAKYLLYKDWNRHPLC
jgi:(S)-ureidoglycine aminohydrolase